MVNPVLTPHNPLQRKEDVSRVGHLTNLSEVNSVDQSIKSDLILSAPDLRKRRKSPKKLCSKIMVTKMSSC